MNIFWGLAVDHKRNKKGQTLPPVCMGPQLWNYATYFMQQSHRTSMHQYWGGFSCIQVVDPTLVPKGARERRTRPPCAWTHGCYITHHSMQQPHHTLCTNIGPGSVSFYFGGPNTGPKGLSIYYVMGLGGGPQTLCILTRGGGYHYVRKM